MSSPAPINRPTWLLALMALPMGMLAAGLTGWFETVPQAVLALLGWLAEPTRLQRLCGALTGNIVVPALLVFSVLRFTRAGAWLAPNRMVVGALLGFAALLLGLSAHAIYEAAHERPPYLVGTIRDVVHAALWVACGTGLAVLALSTLWHRRLRGDTRALHVAQRLWAES